MRGELIFAWSRVVEVRNVQILDVLKTEPTVFANVLGMGYIRQ